MKTIDVVIFVLLSTSVFGFQKWVVAGDNVTIGNESFLIRDSEDNTAIVFQSNASRGIVVVPIGEEIIDGLLSFGYVDSEPVDSSIEKFNITTVHSENFTYKHKILIENVDTKVDLSRKFSVSSFTFKDKFNITVTIKNSGEVKVYGTYLDTLPVIYLKTEPLIVIKDEIETEYLQNENSIKWTATILPGESITLIQEVQLSGSNTLGDYNLNEGVFEYEYEGTSFTQSVKSSSPKYIQPIEGLISIDSKTCEFGTKHNISVKVTNNFLDTEIREISFDIPEIIVVEDSDDFNSDMEWSGEIIDSKTFDLTLLPIQTGKAKYTLNIEYSFRGLIVTEKVTESIDCTIKQPEVTLTLPKNSESNQNITLEFTVKTFDYDIVNVEIQVSSEVFGKVDFSYSSVKENSELKKDFIFSTPLVSHSQAYPVYFNMTFDTEFGEAFSNHVERILTVNKADFKPHLMIDILKYNLSENQSSELCYNISQATNWSIDSAGLTIGIDSYKQAHALDVKKLNESYILCENLTLPSGISMDSINIKTVYTIGGMRYETEKVSNIGLISSLPQTKPVVAAPTKTQPGMKYQKPGFSLKENENAYFSFGTLIVSVSIVLAAFFVLVFYVSLSKKDKSKESKFFQGKKKDKKDKEDLQPVKMEDLDNMAPVPTTDLTILDDYVKISIMNGKSKENIKGNLINNGWMPEVIEVYLK